MILVSKLSPLSTTGDPVKSRLIGMERSLGMDDELRYELEKRVKQRNLIKR